MKTTVTHPVFTPNQRKDLGFLPAVFAVCFTLACSLPVQAQTTLTPPPPVLIPIFECVEAAQSLAGTPIASLTQPAPWGVFSYYSSHPSALFIPKTQEAGNWFYPNPGNYAYPVQTTTFYPGYHKDVMSFQLGIDQNGDNLFTTSPLNWGLNGALATSWTTAQLTTTHTSPFCSATLIPATPVLSFGGTYAHVLLATLLNPPGQVAVQVATRYSIDALYPDTPNPTPDNNSTNLTNLQYENGNIYADVTVPSGSGTFVAWPEVIASVNGTVIAFGHTPIVEGGQCSATLQPASLPSGQLDSSYSESFSVTGSSGTFTYSTTGSLPPGLALSGSTLSGTPTTAGSYSFTVAAIPSDNSCIASGNYSITVAGPTCASDVSSQVAITLSGLHKNLATGQWTETVNLQNTGSVAIGGPINLVLESLSSNATLVNSQGVTNCFGPSGAPYVSVGGSLAGGQTASLTLTFTNSQAAQSITFTPRVAAGGNQL